MYLAYCGQDCHTCPVYTATQNKDWAMRRRLAADYSTPGCSFVARDMICEGCHSHIAEHSRMCGGCDMRRCARQNGVETCAHCPAYPCQAIAGYLPPGSEGRRRLDQIRLAVRGVL